MYVQTPWSPQQVGAIIATDGRPEGNSGLRLDALLPALQSRLDLLPQLRRTLVGRRWFQRPAWRVETGMDIRNHISEHRMDVPGDTVEWTALVNEFFAAPVSLERPPWELRLVHGGGLGTTVVLAKMHHALGDGIAVLSMLLGLLADEGLACGGWPQPTRPAKPSWTQRRRRYRKVVTGLASLARSGTAPALSIDRGQEPHEQRYIWLELSTAKVAQAARAHRVNSPTLLTAVVAEAVHRTLDATGLAPAGGELRALVPKTARGAMPPSGTPRAPGNWSAALSLDLPVGPMSPEQRLVEIAARTKALERRGQPAASQLAMAAFGLLPAPMHAWVLRRLYGRRFFNVIVSILPGPRQLPHLAGAPVCAVYPMLPLAEGVVLGVCALRWGEMTGLGLTTTSGFVSDPAEFASLVRAAFDDLLSRTQP